MLGSLLFAGFDSAASPVRLYYGARQDGPRSDARALRSSYRNLSEVTVQGVL